MTDKGERTDDPLEAVHVCKVCGTATERAAANADNTITGLVRCSGCGREGDLNIEIRSNATKRPPGRANS